MKKPILIVLGVVVAVLMVALLWPKPAVNPRAILPDGSIITLESVTYGSQHEFVFSTGDWRGRLRRGLPRPFRRLIPGGGGSTMSSTGPNGIVLWVSHLNPATGLYLNPGNTYNLDVVDEHGCTTLIGGWGSSGGPRGFLINSFALECFPRRAPTFTLRIKSRTAGANSNVLAEIRVPNPARGPFPVWKPDPLPQTRTHGELTIVLKGMDMGGSGHARWFAPELERTKHGLPADDWSSALVGIHDATGNEHPTRLCTNEPAWNLEIEFYRNEKARFAAHEVWALTNLAVPAIQQVHTLNATGVVNGARLEWIAIGGPGSFVFSNGVPVSPGSIVLTASQATYSSSDSEGTMRVQSATVGGIGIQQLDLTRKGAWLLGRVDAFKAGRRFLVRGRDDRGNSFSTAAITYAQDYCLVPMPIPEGAGHIDLEFIVHDTFKEEFIVRPPLGKER